MVTDSLPLTCLCTPAVATCAWVLQKVCSVFSVDTEYWEEILALNQRRRIHTFYERLPSPFSRFEHSLLTYELAEFQKFDHKSCVEDRAISPQQDLPMQGLGSQGNQQLLFHREQRSGPHSHPTLCLYKSGRFPRPPVNIGTVPQTVIRQKS